MENEEMLAAMEDPSSEGEPSTQESSATPDTPPVAGEPETVPTVPSPPESDGVQQRINKVTADKYAALRRAEDAESRLRDFERQIKESQTPDPGPPDLSRPPRVEDYDFDEEKYQADLNKYQENLIEQRVKESVEKLRQEDDERKKRYEEERLNQEFSKRVVAANLPDYSEAIDNLSRTGVIFPQEVINAIRVAEKGPQIVYHLAKNLNVANQIANLPAARGILELGKIEARLSVKKSQNTTQAPEPIKPVGGAGALDKKVEDMSMDELYQHLTHPSR